MRSGEVEGREYYFRTEEQLHEDSESGNIVEMRTYDTINGLWRYYTMLESGVDYSKDDYLITGPAPQMEKMKEMAAGRGFMVNTIYTTVKPDVRLQRLLDRESRLNKPNYEEMCRRFLSDEVDFRPYKNYEYDFVVDNSYNLEASVNNILRFMYDRGVGIISSGNYDDLQLRERFFMDEKFE